MNLHKGIVELGEGLILAGFGGCNDMYLENEDGEVIKQIYEPFPFETDEDLAKEFEILAKELDKKIEDNPDLQIILMTHIGPYTSKTAIDALEFKESSQVTLTHPNSHSK